MFALSLHSGAVGGTRQLWGYFRSFICPSRNDSIYLLTKGRQLSQSPRGLRSIPPLHSINLWEMAEFLLRQDVVNAINLDGGGSATFVRNGTLASYPSDHW